MRKLLVAALVIVFTNAAGCARADTGSSRDSSGPLVPAGPATIARDTARPETTRDSAVAVFSDMELHEKTGDVVGYELSLRKRMGHWKATFQSAEGELGRCDTLDVKYEHDTVSLLLKPDSGWTQVNGEKRWAEVRLAWPLRGIIASDTLLAVIERRWRSGETREDSLQLPRQARAYSPACVGDDTPGVATP